MAWRNESAWQGRYMDNLMRIKNHQVAAELLEISLGTTREFEGG